MKLITSLDFVDWGLEINLPVPSGRFLLHMIISLLKKIIKTNYGVHSVILKVKLQKAQEIKKCNECSTLCS